VEGGVNFAKITAQCVEDGDCLLWTGICSVSGVPKVNIRVREGKGGRTVLSARRVVWELVKGPLQPRKLITTTCGNPKCLNPDHLAMTNHAKVAAKNGARMDVKLRKRAAGLAQAHQAKLTREQADEIRAAIDVRVKDLAARFGVGESAIRRIRTGVAWRDQTNPFAALMA
jgi:hypothetical protein